MTTVSDPNYMNPQEGNPPIQLAGFFFFFFFFFWSKSFKKITGRSKYLRPREDTQSQTDICYASAVGRRVVGARVETKLNKVGRILLPQEPKLQPKS